MFNSCMGWFMMRLGMVWNFQICGLFGFFSFAPGLVYRGVGSGLLTKLWLWPTDRKTPDVQPTANSYNLHVIAIIWDFGF